MSLNIYPNPLEDGSVVELYTSNKTNLVIDLCDVSMQRALSVYEGQAESGSHQFPLQDIKKLRAGLYILKVKSNEQILSRKLIVR
jgi:hypothetical protein